MNRNVTTPPGRLTAELCPSVPERSCIASPLNGSELTPRGGPSVKALRRQGCVRRQAFDVDPCRKAYCSAILLASSRIETTRSTVVTARATHATRPESKVSGLASRNREASSHAAMGRGLKMDSQSPSVP